jgi:hypothetical protein
MENTENSMERKYSFWQALGLSFFSKALYDDVGRHWKGTGYKTLFLLIVLIAIPRAVNVQLSVMAHLPGFVKSIPDFQIDKGVFSCSVSQPYEYKFQNSEIVIDTTGKINSLDQVPDVGNLDNVILVNKTKKIERRKRFGISTDQTNDFSRYPSFAVNQEKLGRWSGWVIRLSGIVCFLITVSFGFLMEAAIFLVYGLIGVLFSEMLDKSLDFIVALRLVVVSHIPVMWVTTFLIFFGVTGVWDFIVGFFLAIPYLYFAVNSQESRGSAS